MEQEGWTVVVTEECVSSEHCVSTAPDLFIVDESGYASAIAEHVDVNRTDDLREAAEGCPVGAIRISRS